MVVSTANFSKIVAASAERKTCQPKLVYQVRLLQDWRYQVKRVFFRQKVNNLDRNAERKNNEKFKYLDIYERNVFLTLKYI